MKITDKIKEKLGDEAFGKIKELLGGKELYLLDEKDYIPKAKFNDILDENKKLKTDADELKNKITELEKGSKEKDETVESQLADLKTKLQEMENLSKEKDLQLAREKKTAFLKDKLNGAGVNQKYLKHALSEFDVDKIDLEKEEDVQKIEEQIKTVQESFPNFFGEERATGEPPSGGGTVEHSDMKEVSTEEFISEAFNGN